MNDLRQLGAIVSALGLTGLLWEVSAARSRTGYVSGRLFIYAIPAVLAIWLVARWLTRRASRQSVAALWTTVRTSCLVALALLPACTVVAGHYDPKMPVYATAMKAELHYLMRLQDQLLADSGRYLSRIDSTLSLTYVTPPEIVLTNDGWTAIARHTISPQVCAVYVGTSAVPPAVTERTPSCTPLRTPFNVARALLYAVLLAGGLAVGALGALRHARRTAAPAP